MESNIDFANFIASAAVNPRMAARIVMTPLVPFSARNVLS